MVGFVMGIFMQFVYFLKATKCTQSSMGSSSHSGTNNICPRKDRIRCYTFLMSTVLLNRSGFASLKLVVQLLKLFEFGFFFQVSLRVKLYNIYTTELTFPLNKTYRGTSQNPQLYQYLHHRNWNYARYVCKHHLCKIS